MEGTAIPDLKHYSPIDGHAGTDSEVQGARAEAQLD